MDKQSVESGTESKIDGTTDILVLEKLGDTEEQCCRFLRSERLSDIEQVYDLGKQSPTFSRADGRFVEDAGLLNDGRFVMIVLVDATLVVFFNRRHLQELKNEDRLGRVFST